MEQNDKYKLLDFLNTNLDKTSLFQMSYFKHVDDNGKSNSRMLFGTLLFLCSTGVMYISKIDPISNCHKICLGLFILVAVINLIWLAIMVYTGLNKANKALSLARRIGYIIPLYDLKEMKEMKERNTDQIINDYNLKVEDLNEGIKILNAGSNWSHFIDICVTIFSITVVIICWAILLAESIL